VPDLSGPDIKPIPVEISQQMILEEFAFTYGNQKCILMLVGWAFLWMILCLIAINFRFRKM
jgi:hypothetical protein